MKKITSIFKTIGIMVIVLVMAQSCIPNIPVGGNPTPTGLTGKIKRAIFYYNIADTIQNDFIYNDSGVLTAINNRFVNYGITNRISVIRGTDMIIWKDSAISGQIIYLKHGTKLVDSMYDYYNGTLTTRCYIERDNINNLNKIVMKQGNTNADWIIIDSFIYNGNNLTSFRGRDVTITIVNATINHQVEYDLTKTKKINTDSYFLGKLISFLDYYNISLDILDVSLGNTNNNAILSYTYMPTFYPYNNEKVNYVYNGFTPTDVNIQFTDLYNNPIGFQHNTYY